MEKIVENLRQGNDVRANLIEARQRLKQAGEKEFLKKLLAETPDFIGELLHNEDPKVRKNAALLMGDLRLEEMLDALYQTYLQEETLFIRKDYLKAMDQMNLSAYQQRLEQRLEEMTHQEVSEENQKHYREELFVLRKIVLRNRKRKQHTFTGFGKKYDVILTTNRNHREVTARQAEGKRVSMVPLGVKVQEADLKQIMQILTFRELLFLLDIQTVEAEPEKAAETLAGSDLLKLLEGAHDKTGILEGPALSEVPERTLGTGKVIADPFYFRISVVGRMPLDKRSAFIKKISFELEQRTGHRLVNTASDYEIEIRLVERKDGTFLPLVKLYTLKDERFSYRKESIAASIHPSEAAVIAALTKPYLKEKNQVLDPFCGVGTMLMERDRAVKAGSMYGIDIFGEAIQKARENTALAGKEINYINRDFFDFTHEYLFDEIFTNMPVRGKKTREEQDMLYQRFFEKASRVLKREGIMVLYSNEKGYIKKQIRLNEGWKLLKEFCMNEKEDFSVYVIKWMDSE